MAKIPRGFKGSAGGKFSVKVRNLPSVLRKIDAYGRKAEKNVKIAIKVAVTLVEAEAKRLIKSGYYKPAIDSGILRSSITSEVVYASRGRVHGEVGTVVHYGIYVHEGTYFMQPRPFLTDALKSQAEQIKKLIAKAFGM